MLILILVPLGLSPLQSDEKKSMQNNKTEIYFPDDEQKDKFSYSEQLLLPMLDFFKSLVENIDTSSEQQIQTIARQGKSNAQLLLAILRGKKKDTEGLFVLVRKISHGRQ